jgi:purine nucleosidase
LNKQGLVLDTDIGGDVDDALALAYALRHPDLDLRAVTTVSGDTTARAHIAARLLAIAGRYDVIVAAGVGGFMDRVWFGHEGHGLPPGPEARVDARHAVDVLLQLSRADPPPVVATVGQQSNLAAAVTRDPTYIDRVPLLSAMGGVFAPITFHGEALGPERDFNLVTDPDASVASLNAGLPIRYVPLDVTLRTTLREGHLERLRGGDDMCRVLAALCDIWRAVLHARNPERVPRDVVSYLHDPLTVATIADQSFVTIERLPVTVAMHDGVPRTFVDPVGGREADVVTGVDADKFVEHWCDVVIGS